MNLKDLRHFNLKRVNRLRCVQRLIESDAFGEAWDKSTPEKHKEVEGWIYLGSVLRLETWVIACQNKQPETMSLRQLRERASVVGIKYYGRLSKSQLIQEIHNAIELNEVVNPEDERRYATLGHEMGQDFREAVSCPIQHA